MWFSNPRPEVAEEAAELAERVGDPELLAYAWAGKCMAAFRAGDFDTAFVWAQKRFGMLDEISDPDHVADIYEFAVGSLCRLEPIKGVEELVQGFARAATGRPKLRLLLGGDGPLKDRLLDLARRAGMGDRVSIEGAWVRPADVLPALDLFVLASLVQCLKPVRCVDSLLSHATSED